MGRQFLEVKPVTGNHLFLARPLDLAAMSDLRSGIQSQPQEIPHFPGVSEIVFFKESHKWTKELRIG